MFVFDLIISILARIVKFVNRGNGCRCDII